MMDIPYSFQTFEPMDYPIVKPNIRTGEGRTKLRPWSAYKQGDQKKKIRRKMAKKSKRANRRKIRRLYMRVLSTTDLSDYGNDCYIHKSVSLVEDFGMYNILTAEKVVGWCKREQMYFKAYPTCNFDKAKRMYKQAGGIWKD